MKTTFSAIFMKESPKKTQMWCKSDKMSRKPICRSWLQTEKCQLALNFSLDFVRFVQISALPSLASHIWVEFVLSEPTYFRQECFIPLPWFNYSAAYSPAWHSLYWCYHEIRTPREEIVFTAQPKIESQFQIFRHSQSIPHYLFTIMNT